jgi:hypothetical protein
MLTVFVGQRMIYGKHGEVKAPRTLLALAADTRTLLSVVVVVIVTVVVQWPHPDPR